MKIQIANDRDIMIDGKHCPAMSVQDVSDEMGRNMLARKYAHQFQDTEETVETKAKVKKDK